MDKHRIERALVCLGITFSVPKQETIVVLKDGKKHHGYFALRVAIDENGAKWKFVLFKDHGKEIIFKGYDIESISMEEEGKRLYYIDDIREIIQLGSSTDPDTRALFHAVNKL
jgi:hypothetical protein